MVMPRLSKDEISDMRRAITSVALDLYRSEGIGAVTMRAIAARLQMSAMHSYRFFPSKEALVVAMQIACLGELDVALRSAAGAGRDSRDRLTAMTMCFLQRARRYQDDYRLMFMSDQARGPASSDRDLTRARIFDFAVGIVDNYLRDHNLDGDARTLAHLTWSGFHGLMTLEISGQLDFGRSFVDLIGPLIRNTLGIQLAPRLHLEELPNTLDQPSAGGNISATGAGETIAI
ncbi:regulatory protein TetR [Sphingobium chlorophenolicum L-1]|uniref:Regulatory protein TetR n=2 Tax=Sphingobium chlorophenolicum TaxID=46429 RepID=F6EUG9_SPHCR|nr:regulatory protein TetR [Sphingobium chlorophenolicum L-1]